MSTSCLYCILINVFNFTRSLPVQWHCSIHCWRQDFPNSSDSVLATVLLGTLVCLVVSDWPFVCIIYHQHPPTGQLDTCRMNFPFQGRMKQSPPVIARRRHCASTSAVQYQISLLPSSSCHWYGHSFFGLMTSRSFQCSRFLCCFTSC